MHTTPKSKPHFPPKPHFPSQSSGETCTRPQHQSKTFHLSHTSQISPPVRLLKSVHRSNFSNQSIGKTRTSPTPKPHLQNQSIVKFAHAHMHSASMPHFLTQSIGQTRIHTPSSKHTFQVSPWKNPPTPTPLKPHFPVSPTVKKMKLVHTYTRLT